MQHNKIKMSQSLPRRALICSVIALVVGIIIPQPVYGITDRQKQVFDRRVLYFNTEVNQCTGTSSSGAIGTDVKLPKEILDRITKLQDKYVAAGKKWNVPWQLLAATHYREADSSPVHDLQAGNRIGGAIRFFTDDYHYIGGPPSTLEESLDAAAQGLIARGKTFIAGKKGGVTGDNPQPDAIKDTMFSYNGRAAAYINEAVRLGYNRETQPFEGSPYVMNKADAARDAMPIISSDFGGVDRRESRYGGYVVYAALLGISPGGAGCGGVGNGDIVGIAMAEKGNKEDPIGCDSANDSRPGDCGAAVNKYTDNHLEYWCADFVSWVYKQAGKPFTGGLSGGWRIPSVDAVGAWFIKNGVYTENGSGANPKPGDIYIIGNSSHPKGQGDHIGIVVKVEGDTLYTISGNTSLEDYRNGVGVGEHPYPNFRSDSRVRGFGSLK